MKELHLGKVSTLRINNRLIISLDDRWCKIFENTDPKFSAKIDKKGNYVLVGPNLKNKPTRTTHTKVISESV